MAAAATVLASGCGAAPSGPAASTSPAPDFAWFRAASAPAGWKTLALPDGSAVMSIPPEAAAAPSDPGSVSAEVDSPSGDLVLYLNATPKQGDEALATWPEFRLDHLSDENGKAATRMASRTGMTFLGGTGSCVSDFYETRAGKRYREIACFIQGARGGSVLVAATPDAGWDSEAPLVQQAVDAYAAE